LRPSRSSPDFGIPTPDEDEGEGDGQAHQLPDEVQDVLVGFPVHLQPGDVVDRERLGSSDSNPCSRPVDTMNCNPGR
jgi:hypothetical protein